MRKWLSVQAFAMILLLVEAGAAAVDSPGDGIAAAIDTARPAVPMTAKRQEALKALDAWVAQPDSEGLPSCIAYYQAAVERVLSTLEKERVASGVRIFQLYSSSVVVQTPETVFAFDLDPGPNEDSPKTAPEEGVSFRMTDAQVARLARLVDYAFHTHEHSDHIDLALTKALLTAGKTVVVTESNRARWQRQPWAEKLTVLDQTVKAPVETGPLKVDVLRDHQWNNATHTSGTPCDAFVVTTPGGVTVMTKGDINCGLQLYGWLGLLKQRGQRVDVVVGSLLFWRGVNTLAQWNELFSPLWLPGHAWEFTHRRAHEAKGNCAAFVQSWQMARSMSRSERVQVLSWGEWIDVAGHGCGSLPDAAGRSRDPAAR